jgi:hypothetical protein
MASFIIYVIKWAICLTLLYSLYGLFLRRETFHRLNRAVLVGIMVVSMVLPCFQLTIPRPTPLSLGMENLTQVVEQQASKPSLTHKVARVEERSLTEMKARKNATLTQPTPTWTGLQLVIMAYLGGVVIFLLLYMGHPALRLAAAPCTAC